MRRFRLLREQMESRDLDVMLVVGRDGPGTRGDFRYVANYGPVTPLPSYVVFPRADEEPVFLARTANRSRAAIESGWVREMRQTWVGLDELLVDVVAARCGSGRLGVARLDNLPVPLYLALVERFGADGVVDAGDVLAAARRVKGAEEIALARDAGRAADAAHRLVRDWLRPGRTDRELYGEARRMMHLSGADYSMDLVGIDTPNVHVPVGDAVGEDSYVVGELTPAVGGIFNQLPFEFTFGAARGRRAPLNNAMREAHASMAAALRSGLPVAELYEIGRAAIESGGFTPAPGQYGHDLGYDVVDTFSILPDSDVVLEAGNLLVLHPVGSDDGGPRLLVGQTFAITDDGAECLNEVDPFVS